MSNQDKPPGKSTETEGLSKAGKDRRTFVNQVGKLSVVAAAGAYFASFASTAAASVMGGGGPERWPYQNIPSPNSHVPPGQYDEYYGFWSGGQSGEIRILGIPSMRELARISLCGNPENIDNYTKNLLRMPNGKVPQVADTHHCHLSYKDGTYDGQYAFINDKANGRLARIRLDTFIVDAVTDLPHSQGTHGIFPSRTELNAVYCNSEFRNPLPNDGRLMDKPHQYGCLHTCVDAKTMKVRWQCLVDGNMDICATDYKGKYSMATCYNSEDGVTVDQMMAKDRDWLVVFNLAKIEAAVKSGKYTKINGSGAPVIDGRGKKNPYTIYIPIPKNPHGVNIDPTGTYAICSGKLSPTVSVIPLKKIDDCFAGKITNPRDCVIAEPEVGLGPLHTAFDGRGNAYTSIFIDSVSTKWNIAKAVAGKNPVLEKLDVHYQPGHTNATMSETNEAVGDWLVSLNKFSKDRFLPVGPRFDDNDQLIDISQKRSKKMRLVHDGAIHFEPHDCVIVKREIIRTLRIWDFDDRKFDFERNLLNRLAKKHLGGKMMALNKTNHVFREGNKVYAFMTSQAPKFGLTQIDVKQGDEVTISLTNIDDVEDLTHGFCLSNYDINFGCDPHETNSVTFIADKKGVYWYYCTWFCHALHLEMRGRLLVS